MTVHPRVRGAKPLMIFLIMTATGSPPRSRGKAERPVCFWLSKRFTPAFAGQRT